MLDKPSCDFTMITLKQFSKDLKTSLNTNKKNQINHSSVTDAYLAVCRDILSKNQVSSYTYDSKRFLSIVHLGDNFRHPGVKITSAPSIFALIEIQVNRFSQYLAFEIFHRPDSWQGFLYIYLFSFPRFQSFCIEWFASLFFIA